MCPSQWDWQGPSETPPLRVTQSIDTRDSTGLCDRHQELDTCPASAGLVRILSPADGREGQGSAGTPSHMQSLHHVPLTCPSSASARRMCRTHTGGRGGCGARVHRVADPAGR